MSWMLVFVFQVLGSPGGLYLNYPAAQPEVGRSVIKVEDFYARLIGTWEGRYSLWLQPDLPAEESQIRAGFKAVVKGNYYQLSYSWARSGEEQEGLFLLSARGDQVTATWGDSFHMTPEPMQCKGRFDGGGKLILDGSYSFAPGEPAWGWRTEFTLQLDDVFLMEAYNITPQGQEGLAVRAVMRRVSPSPAGSTPE